MTQNPLHEIACVDCQTYIEEYMADELDTTTHSAITSHLSTCDRCQHEFQMAQAIDTVLDDLPKPTSPQDILQEVTDYVRVHPNTGGWMHRFVNIFTLWENTHTLFLRLSMLTCFIGIVLFGIHQHQKHVAVEQAKNDFNYAISKMHYAFHRTSLAVNDSFESLKIDEAPRRALKPAANISSAINQSLGILNHLTGDVQNSDTQKYSDTIIPKLRRSGGSSTEPTSPNQGGNTQ